MRHIYIIMSVLLLITLSGCKHFATWKDYNQTWLDNFTKNEFGKDSDIVRTITFPSGVMAEVFHDGYGAYPKRTEDPVRGYSSQVYITIEGKLVDGDEFLMKGTSSYYVSDLIDGLQEALCSMRQGSHWKIYIPYSQGYGESGSTGSTESGNFVVPPYSVLIFDIDLLDVTNF